MGTVKNAYRKIKDTIYNDESLSLPFIKLYHSENKLAFFVYECDYDDDDNMTITDITKSIYVDIITEQVDIVKGRPNGITFPIIIKSDIVISLDDIEELYDNYYKALQNYFDGCAQIQNCVEAFRKITPSQLVGLYKVLGAVGLQSD